MKRAELKRTPFQRTTPMPRGSSTLARTVMKKHAPKKRAGHDKAVRDTCKDQPCYLRILMTGIPCSALDTVVPAHANDNLAGKGAGLKARDVFTIPACGAHHAELDQGMRFTKEEKKAMWRAAYAAWGPAREKLFKVPYDPLPGGV